MYFSAGFLSDLTGAEIGIVDLNKVPYQDKLACDSHYIFSDEETKSRESAIRDQFYKIDSMLEANGLRGWARFLAAASSAREVAMNGKTGESGWAEHSRLIGEKIFGNGFRDFKPSPLEADVSIILPNPPDQTGDDFWAADTGLDGLKTSKKPAEILEFLHEVGHIVFPYAPEELALDEIGYQSEVLADCFAASIYLEIGGDKTHVRDYIDARRLRAFFGKDMGGFPTAKAIEAMLCGETIPSYAESADALCELKIRAFDDMHGIDRSNLDRTSCRRACRLPIKTMGDDGVIKEKDLWASECAPFYSSFKNATAPVVMKSLRRVLGKSGRLSLETRLEGEAILRAYENFCFSDPIHVSPSTAVQ